ncbi:MAG: Hsp20/alpha crystallin family protein [Clostridia bacterium]|nr:Hsp20/alpha crystallin family protein [Clostridia bacterium]
MLPSIFGENLFDTFFDDAFDTDFFRRHMPAAPKHVNGLMKTDVKESDQGFQLSIDLPGYKKDEVQIAADGGYLTITAAHNSDEKEEGEVGKFIRRERYSGSCRRSFYIGEDVKPEDVKAKFEDGILTLRIPKVEPQLPEQTTKYIAIE